MSLPNIPNITPIIDINREEAITLLLASIAMEEIGLSHIINAEGEKIQYVLNSQIHKSVSIKELIEVNQGVEKVIREVMRLQMLLQQKLESVISVIPKVHKYPNPCDTENPCNKPCYPEEPCDKPCYPEEPCDKPCYPKNPCDKPCYPEAPCDKPCYPEEPCDKPCYPEESCDKPFFLEKPGATPFFQETPSVLIPKNLGANPFFPKNPCDKPCYPEHPDNKPCKPNFRPECTLIGSGKGYLNNRSNQFYRETVNIEANISNDYCHNKLFLLRYTLSKDEDDTLAALFFAFPEKTEVYCQNKNSNCLDDKEYSEIIIKGQGDLITCYSKKRLLQSTVDFKLTVWEYNDTTKFQMIIYSPKTRYSHDSGIVKDISGNLKIKKCN